MPELGSTRHMAVGEAYGTRSDLIERPDRECACVLNIQVITHTVVETQENGSLSNRWRGPDLRAKIQ